MWQRVTEPATRSCAGRGHHPADAFVRQPSMKRATATALWTPRSWTRPASCGGFLGTCAYAGAFGWLSLEVL